jgi:hypothetical protein
MISKKQLHDGCWYKGRGRNSTVGLWDEKGDCFWIICMNDFQDPEKYPKGSKRKVRLKQEFHFSSKEGTFKPNKKL